MILFKYECKNCGNEFKSPGLGDFSYGEFIMRSCTGEIAYLDANNCPAFEEFSQLLRNNSHVKNLSSTDQANIFHELFYLSCDPAKDNSILSMMQKPVCTTCGESKIGKWGPTYPPEKVDMEIKPVTHKIWDQLSLEQKQKMIDTALKAL